MWSSESFVPQFHPSNSLLNNQGNSVNSVKGPGFLISRSQLMLTKIRVHQSRLQYSLLENKSLQLSLDLEARCPEVSIFESNHVKSYSDSWDIGDQVKKPSLFELISNGIRQHEHPDLLIRFKNAVFRCHLAILNCYTKYFSTSMQRNRFEFKEDSSMTAVMFMKFYNWVLSENVSIGENDVLHLLCAAELLNVDELRRQCWIVLENAVAYSENVAYKLYRGGKEYRVQSIQQLMLPRVWKYFLTLLATEDFLQMEADEICHWLQANTIGVNSEMEIFYAAVLWLNSKWNERKGKPLRKVMRCVRFGLLPAWFLVSLHTVKHHYDVVRVVKDMKVMELIADGLSLTTAMAFYSKNSEEFEDFLHRGNLRIPMQRKWLVDTNCPYHYSEGSQTSQHICYEKFVEYLQYLRSGNQSHWRELKPASENHWNFVFNQQPNRMTFNVN